MHIQKPLLSSWPFPTTVTTVEEIAGLHPGTGWWLSSLDISLSGLEPQGLWQDQWWSSTTQVGPRDGGETGGACLTDLPRSPHTFRHRLLEFFFSHEGYVRMHMNWKIYTGSVSFFKFRAALCKCCASLVVLVNLEKGSVTKRRQLWIPFSWNKKNRRHPELLGELVMIFLIRTPQSEVEKSSYYGANNSKWQCSWKIPGSHKVVMFSIPTLNCGFNDFERQPFTVHMLHSCTISCLPVETGAT